MKLNNDEHIFDVKDFEEKEIGTGYFVGVDEYGPLREKIEQGRRKFKDKCCCLVLVNKGNYDVDLTDPDVVFGAMYGDVGISILFDVNRGEAIPSTERLGYFKGGKMVRPHTGEPQNTTISALISLRLVPTRRLRCEQFLKGPENTEGLEFDPDEVNLGVMVWENVDARKPLPRNLFQGDYDVRFEFDGTTLGRVFAGRIIGELEPDPFATDV